MRFFLLSVLLISSGGVLLNGQDTPVRELELEEARRIVLLNNFEIASRRLGLESARELFEGEKGALLEPVLVMSADRVSNERENNTEEFIRQGVEDFSEDNSLYNVGLEQPLPTGGTLQLSYNVDHLENNLQEQRELDFDEKEYDSFAGVTLVQPLLRNGGVSIGLSMIKMAREESEVAFQEYRRQLMQSLGEVEAAYWELSVAQERVALREKSLEVAQKILEDNRARVANGKMPELEVREAEAGLANRRSQFLEAQQNLEEISARLLEFLSLPDLDPAFSLRASENPAFTELPDLNIVELREKSLKYHPDVLISEHRLNQDELRMEYAKNQLLPQLDLRASYGYNGLAESHSEAFDAAREDDFPSWTLGVELRVPLGGGQRQRAERDAAVNRMRQSELGLEAIRRKVAQGVRTSVSRVRNFYSQAVNYQEVSDMNETILETELKRLDAGRSDSRNVLDAEEKLTQAREAYVVSLSRLAVAKVEMALSSGTLLENLNVDPMMDTYLEEVSRNPVSLEEVVESSEEELPESAMDETSETTDTDMEPDATAEPGEMNE